MQRDPLNELLMVNYANNLATRGDMADGQGYARQTCWPCARTRASLLRFMAKMEINNGNLVQGWELANRAYQLAARQPRRYCGAGGHVGVAGRYRGSRAPGSQRPENSDQNPSLLETHWMTLVVERRFEEAELLLRDQMAEIRRQHARCTSTQVQFSAGHDRDWRVAITRSARDLLVSAISAEDDPAYSGDEIMTITMAACATETLGEEEAAAELLAKAERQIKRARLNGVDNPDIYYNEAILLAMRSEPAEGMEKLREAYDTGLPRAVGAGHRRPPCALRDKPEFIALTESDTG